MTSNSMRHPRSESLTLVQSAALTLQQLAIYRSLRSRAPVVPPVVKTPESKMSRESVNAKRARQDSTLDQLLPTLAKKTRRASGTDVSSVGSGLSPVGEVVCIHRARSREG